MATTKKPSETKKATAKNDSTTKKAPVKTDVKPNLKEAEALKTEASKTEKGTGKTIAIVILSGILVFAIIVFVVLFATGVIRFNNDNGGPTAEKIDDDIDGPEDDDDDDRTPRRKHGNDSSSNAKKGDIIDNPYVQTKEDDETLVSVDDLEFYLPDEFEEGGKNKDGAFTYNLTDDDGWAQALVYAEHSSLSPSAYIHKISSNLEITNRNLWIKGTSWVRAGSDSVVVYATKLDGKIYAVYFAVKLDSDATDDAIKMIPKTLYMKKIIKE